MQAAARIHSHWCRQVLLSVVRFIKTRLSIFYPSKKRLRIQTAKKHLLYLRSVSAAPLERARLESFRIHSRASPFRQFRTAAMAQRSLACIPRSEEHTSELQSRGLISY